MIFQFVLQNVIMEIVLQIKKVTSAAVGLDGLLILLGDLVMYPIVIVKMDNVLHLILVTVLGQNIMVICVNIRCVQNLVFMEHVLGLHQELVIVSLDGLDSTVKTQSVILYAITEIVSDQIFATVIQDGILE